MSCNCNDWEKASIDHGNLFQKHPSYGNILTWVEINKEGAYHKTHNYGMKIIFCPFCGHKLKT